MASSVASFRSTSRSRVLRAWWLSSPWEPHVHRSIVAFVREHARAVRRNGDDRAIATDGPRHRAAPLKDVCRSLTAEDHRAVGALGHERRCRADRAQPAGRSVVPIDAVVRSWMKSTPASGAAPALPRPTPGVDLAAAGVGVVVVGTVLGRDALAATGETIGAHAKSRTAKIGRSDARHRRVRWGRRVI